MTPESKQQHKDKRYLGKAVTLRIAAVGIFTSLAFCLTRFFAIPYAGGAGYFNFGDLVSLLLAMAFGPVEGMLVGMLSGAFADFASGYGAFIPWTLAAKGLMGLLAGGLFLLLKKHKVIRFVSPLLGGLLMAAVYAIAYLALYGLPGLANTPFDLVQGLGCALLSIALYLPLEKTGVIRRIQQN